MLNRKLRKIKKDRIVRKNNFKNEFNLLINKYNLNNNLLFKYKYYIFFKMMRKFHLNSSICRIKNTCVISGRTHWVLSKFHISRMVFKNFVDYGIINGIKRAFNK